jgi:hypothetical protein
VSFLYRILSLLWRQMAPLWQLYGLVLLLLTIASALLSVIPMLSGQITDTSLQQSLQEMHVAERNLLLQGEPIPPEIEKGLQTDLDDIYLGKFEMRDTTMMAERTVIRPNGPDPIDGSLLNFLNLHLYSFVGLQDYVTVLDGRMPQPGQSGDPQIEVAIGRPVADYLDLHLDDLLLTIQSEYQFKVVGIVEPIRPGDDRWWGDSQLLPFNLWRRISFNPDFVEANVSLLPHPETLANVVPSSHTWRVFLDGSRIVSTNAAEVAKAVSGLESKLTSSRVSLDTDLVDMLEQFDADIETSQLSMLLLVSQSLLAVLYALAMLGQGILAQVEGEISTRAARGHTPWRVTRKFAARYTLLALIAWPLGGGVAALFSSQTAVPALSWSLGAVAMLFGLVVLVGPIPGLARRGILLWTQRQSHPQALRNRTRRLLLDGAILGLGALSYWQLRQFSGQALIDGKSITIDPFLLMGPTLLVLGFALLVRHVVPLIIRLLAWLNRRSKRLLLPLALAWLGRDHGRSGHFVFLVSVTTGLALFATIFMNSLTARQDEMALYRSGAHLRWSMLEEDLPTVTAALLSDDDVAAMTTVFRAMAVPDPKVSTRQIELLAVSPNATNVIAPYPSGVNPVSLEAALDRLTDPAPDAIPALLSRHNVLPGMAIGDRFSLRVADEELSLELRGIIDDFATLRTPFVVVNLDSLRPFLAGKDLHGEEAYEMWVTVKAEAGNRLSATRSELASYDSLVSSFGTVTSEPQLLSDAAALRTRYGNHLLSQQILGALRLNVRLLIVLSFTSLLLLQLLDGWRKRHSWGALMALGVSRFQVAGVTVSEGIALLLVGLSVGAGLGLALAQITLPLLAVTLSASIGGSMEAPLLLDWLALGRLMIISVTLYSLAILGGLWAIRRVEMGQLLRQGE